MLFLLLAPPLAAQTMPDCRNRALEPVEQSLRRLGVKEWKILDSPRPGPPARVLAQSPLPGTVLESSTRVRLWVSIPQETVVPRAPLDPPQSNPNRVPLWKWSLFLLAQLLLLLAWLKVGLPLWKRSRAA
ncbi:MAG: PASTA domain-containing protein [Armatimonadetes bacterium]|nr:PASTA domain-containing protein [Armatimonadota bacterium]